MPLRRRLAAWHQTATEAAWLCLALCVEALWLFLLARLAGLV